MTIKTFHIEPARLEIEIEPIFLNYFYNLSHSLKLFINKTTVLMIDLNLLQFIWFP